GGPGRRRGRLRTRRRRGGRKGVGPRGVGGGAVGGGAVGGGAVGGGAGSARGPHPRRRGPPRAEPFVPRLRCLAAPPVPWSRAIGSCPGRAVGIRPERRS